MTKDIRERFVIPLREMLVVARAHSKQELELKVEEGKRGRKAEETTQQGKGPELNVQVMGTTLPKISLQDELKVYKCIHVHVLHVQVYIRMVIVIL